MTLASVLISAAYDQSCPNQHFCANDVAYPPYSPLSEDYAQKHRCCLSLPCDFEKGCWANQTHIPLYSAPRTRAFSREQARVIQHDLIGSNIRNGLVQRRRNPAMPDYPWFQMPIPIDDPRFSFVYQGITDAFHRTFRKTMQVTVPLDVFFIDDFSASKFSNDETYESDVPGAGFWIHNDCNNFQLCHAETNIPTEQFTGNAVTFVLPIIVPHDRLFEDDPHYHVTALELYNVSQGSIIRSKDGEEVAPPNRQWASVHGYNVGEIIWFHPYRYHSGHVPRTRDFDDKLNPHQNRSEIVGFTAELTNGTWVMFRMCKGSTDDTVKEKILPEKDN